MDWTAIHSTQLGRMALLPMSCDGNHLLAARFLGIGKTTVYQMARAYKYQPPKEQGKGLITVSQRTSLYLQHRHPTVNTWI